MSWLKSCPRRRASVVGVRREAPHLVGMMKEAEWGKEAELRHLVVARQSSDVETYLGGMAEKQKADDPVLARVFYDGGHGPVCDLCNYSHVRIRAKLRSPTLQNSSKFFRILQPKLNLHGRRRHFFSAATPRQGSRPRII